MTLTEPSIIEQCNHFRHYVELEPTIKTIQDEKQIVSGLVAFLESKECTSMSKFHSDKVFTTLMFHQKRLINLEKLM